MFVTKYRGQRLGFKIKKRRLVCFAKTPGTRVLIITACHLKKERHLLSALAASDLKMHSILMQ